MTTTRKTARSLFAVALLAAGFSISAPANDAHAMNQTPCTTGDLLHIWGHYSRPLIVGPSGPFEYCATVRISRWNIVTYPNQPPNITSIQIF
ncbi:hypothetical protein ACFV6F_08315 [Kitasatospora phosalacinea]|uniref:hypothetical protein n=1 Tax=Kitasatospora phosalacinea TaxID=2065 RepID=UPI003665441D